MSCIVLLDAYYQFCKLRRLRMSYFLPDPFEHDSLYTFFPSTMMEQSSISSKPTRDLVIRYHSPYCEATGPVVQPGTVAARIKALQKAQRELSEETGRSHTPTSTHPPCRLTPTWRPDPAIGSSTGNATDLRRSHSQLADYVRNEIPELHEEVIEGIVYSRSLAFGTPNLRSPHSRRRSFVALNTRSKTASIDSPLPVVEVQALSEVEPEGPCVVGLPGLTRHSSWKRTIKENAAQRTRRSILESSQGPRTLPSRHSATYVNQSVPWIEKRRSLRRVPSDHSSPVTKKFRPYKSIAEQIGEMIDKALEGRTGSMESSTPCSLRPDFTGISGDIYQSRLDSTELPSYVTNSAEHPILIDPENRQDNQTQTMEASESSEPSEPSDIHPLPLRTPSMHSRRFDGRYSFTEDTAYPQSSSDNAGYKECKSTIEHEAEALVYHQPRPRARTCTGRRPSTRCDDRRIKTLKSCSVSSLGSSHGKLLCDNNRFEIFLRKQERRGSANTQGKQENETSPQGHNVSMRSQASKAQRIPSHKSDEKPHAQGTPPKKWKWWKLVTVDKDPFQNEFSGTRADLETREKTLWNHVSHPLANSGTGNESHETSEIVEALERACIELSPSPVRPLAGQDKSSPQHTLAQCGHEDEENMNTVSAVINMLGDGSADAELTMPPTIDTDEQDAETSMPNAQIDVVSQGYGAIVEVRNGVSRRREARSVSREFRGVKVVVTVEEGMGSALVKVEIHPKRR